MNCHVCGHPMKLEFSELYPYKNGKPRPVWRCTNKLFCPEERWAHPDGTPMSLPADRDTKQARNVAHVALANLCRVKGLTTKQSYRWIQKAMGLPKSDAHIGHFDKRLCLRLINLVYEELDQMAADIASDQGLDSVFGYHKPQNTETGLAHEEVRAVCKDAAKTLCKIVPECPERTLMIRRFQEAMMYGNSAIAQHGPNPKAPDDLPTS